MPLITAAVMLLSSCSAASVEELLSPPRLDGEQTDIYEALRTFTNGDIILKYPKSGQYRSAFVVRNLDNEPTDEAIVFYEIPNVSDGSSLRLNFLDKHDGQWVSVYDFAASGSEVESVQFEDLGLGSASIIINYLMQSTSDRFTSVMAYRDGTPAELLNVRNIYTEILDANGDGVNDLFAIINERAAGVALTGIFESRDGELVRAGTTPLSSGLAGIKSVQCGSCSTDGTRAIFIDYAFSDGSFGTDAVINAGRSYYISPALTLDYTVRSSNSYTPYISSKDVDDDGYIEIPSSVPFPEYEELPRSEQVNMTVWRALDRAGTLVVDKLRSFVGTKGDYIFIFPESWEDVTASVSISESTVTFSRWNPEWNYKGEILLKIYGISDSNTEKTDTGEMIFLGKSESSGYSYYAEQTGKQPALSAEELGNLFKLQ